MTATAGGGGGERNVSDGIWIGRLGRLSRVTGSHSCSCLERARLRRRAYRKSKAARITTPPRAPNTPARMVPVLGRDVDPVESDIQALPALALGLPIPGDWVLDDGETGDEEGKRSESVRAVAAGTVIAKPEDVGTGVEEGAELEVDREELAELEEATLLLEEADDGLEEDTDEALGPDGPALLTGVTSEAAEVDVELELDEVEMVDELLGREDEEDELDEEELDAADRTG